jgi:predicted alpha-1,2-mannosidase
MKISRLARSWARALPLFSVLWVATLSLSTISARAADFTKYVDAFSGTAAGAPDYGTGGGAADTYPGAVAPFGMLSWSPATVPSTVNFAAGYSYPDHQLSGFSLTHLSGAGCAAAQDFPFLPTTAPVTSSPAELGSSSIEARYLASFSHAEEHASPGYYQVELDPGTADAISTQLTATPRAGAGVFTYPTGSDASMLINAGGSATADTAASVEIDPAARIVSGSASSAHFCYQQNAYTVYFAAQFDRPFSAYGTWTKQLLVPSSTSGFDTNPAALSYTPLPGGPSSLPGNPSGTAQAGAYVSFDTASDPNVEVRVGLSYVSAADALQNLREETGSKSFEQLRAASDAAWNAALGRIRIHGGTTADRRTFYTALYHALLEPSVFSDENDTYRGMDGQVHTVAPGHAQYANYSGWDIYRSEIPLLSLLYPGRVSDMVQSLLNDQQQSGWLPKWPFADGQTDVMVGDSADPIIADAWAFGARSFSAQTALQAMVKGATQYGVSTNADYVERPALREYEQLGYVPHEENGNAVEATLDPTVPWGSVSTTLEYTTDDFAIARFAADAACDTASYREFMARSGDWEKLYDPSAGYLEPRDADGAFVSGAGATETDDFVEGDAAQYTWMVPYDLAALFDEMGGRAQASARLDSFFKQLNSGPDSISAFLGNEPTLETPWEYDWLGQPFKTQAVIRRALLTLYGPGPAAYPGNDDLGEMSSWYVFGALGLYPEIPGTPILALGSPLFPRAVIDVDGHQVTIGAPKASDKTPFVRGLTINRHVVRRPWITYSTLAKGADLTYRLAAHPSRGWAASTNATPPSFAPTSAPPSCSIAAHGESVR